MSKKIISSYFSKLGKKGGKASAESKTRRQRVLQAKKAANTRWASK